MTLSIDSSSASARLEARQEMQRAQLMIESDPSEAASRLEEAKRLAPDDLEIVGSLAWVQLRLRRYVDAVGNFDRIINLATPNATAAETFAGLAFAHRRLGHNEEAKAWALKALIKDENSDTAREVLAEILISESDCTGALKELARFHNQKSNLTIARVATLRALCKLRLGDFEGAMDTASMLIENGYGNERVQAVFDIAEERVKERVEATMGEMNFARRMFLKLLNKPVLQLYLASKKETKRDMDQLRFENSEQAKSLSTAAEEKAILERRADDANRAASTDRLTGLPNRLCFDRDWRPKFKPGNQIAVIMMDLDKFMLVNDIHGHEGGDKALKKMAAVGASVFRHPAGNLFRFGGEEFLALVFGTKTTVQNTVEFFRASLDSRAATELAREGLELKWEMPAGSGTMVPRRLTASIGVAYYPEHGNDIDELIKKADEAAYAAKEGGRNQVVFYSAPAVKAPKAKAPAKAKAKPSESKSPAAPVIEELEPDTLMTSSELLAGLTEKDTNS